MIRCSLRIPHRLDQFFHGVLVRRFAMISRIPFHERDSLPLHSVGYDNSRPIAHVLRLFQRFDYLTKIEPVDLEDMPVESLPLVGKWLHRHYLFSQTVLLNPVSIDYGGKVAEFEFWRGHGCFPC